jgi:hypothetical protein
MTTDDEWADALRSFSRAAYPAGDGPDPAVVVRAGRRRRTARRAAGTTAACALVAALAFGLPPLIGEARHGTVPVGPETTTPSTPVPGPTRSSSGTAQQPHTVGTGQVATAGQDIQAVNLPAALSTTHMTAADVGGFDLAIDVRDHVATFGGDGSRIGLPTLSVETSWTPAGDAAPFLASSWTAAYDTSPLSNGRTAAALVAGEVPPWIGDAHVYLLANPSFALPDRTAAPALELPTFAAPSGEMLYAVVLRDAAARTLDAGSFGIVIQASDGTLVTPGCAVHLPNAMVCAAGIPGLTIGQALGGQIGQFTGAAAQPYVSPPPPLPLGPGTLPSDVKPTTGAPAAVELTAGIWASTGLSSRAGDLTAVDPNVAGGYYLAGDLGGASMRIGVTTDAVPRLTVFGVTTWDMTSSLQATSSDPYLAFEPLDVRIPQTSAYFRDAKGPAYTAGVTPVGTPRVFVVATWGFDLSNGTHTHALEVPTFAPPDSLTAALKPGQRLWVTSDAGAPSTVGSGWSGYVYAANDGTILDPSCLDAPGSADACARQDLDFGAYDEIRAMLTK